MSALISFLISFTFIKLASSKNNDKSIDAIQAAHSAPTPRLGGIAVLIAFALIGYFYSIIPVYLALSLLPIIAIGLLEDLNFETAPAIRLIIFSISALFCITSYSSVIERIDYVPIQWFFSIFFLALAFTVFAVVGMVNAVNFIDGLHGFSGFQSITMLGSITYLATSVGEQNIALMSVLLIFSIAGFLLLNFPKGLIFLGDAGAYSIGFLVAVFAIKLHNDFSDQISSWAILLIVFWPVSDLLLAIVRRVIKNKETYKPDFMHFHHVVLKSVEIFTDKGISRKIANPLATVFLAPVSCIPAVIAVLNYNNPKICFFSVIFLGIAFIASYAAASQFSRIGRQ